MQRKGKNCSLYSLVCPDSSPLLLPTKSTDMNINWMATRMWIKTNMEMQKKFQIIFLCFWALANRFCCFKVGLNAFFSTNAAGLNSSQNKVLITVSG